MSHSRRQTVVEPPLLGALPALVPQPAPRMVTPEVTTVLNATTPGNATPLLPTGVGGGVLEVISPLSLDGTAIPRGRMYAQAWVVDSLGNRLFTVWSGYLATAGSTPAGPASVPGIPLDPSWSIIAVVTQTGQGAATRIGFAAFISPGGVARGSPGYIHSEPPGEGTGEPRSFTLTTPAAGANFATETVPAKTRWKLVGYRFTLVASVAAANRSPRLTYNDGSNDFMVGVSDYLVTASQTMVFVGGIGVPHQRTGLANGLIQHIPLPDVTLEPASELRQIVQDLQAADQLSSGVMKIEEWAIP